MAAEKSLLIRIVGDATGAKSAFMAANSAADKFGRKMERVGRNISAMGDTWSRRVTLPIVAGLGLATKAAIDEEKEMTLLAVALRNTAQATDEQVAATERWITATQNATGISDGQLRPALANLVRVTHDISAAQKLMGTAMDISVAKGKPLETVTMAIAKAYNGNIGSLGRLGIATKNAAGETLSFEQVMANAAKTFGGSAAEAADTTAGKLAILKARFADITESIGNAVIPILEDLVPIAQKIAKWFENLSDGQRAFAVKVALAVAALGPMLSIFGRLITVGGTLVRTFNLIRTAILSMTAAGKAADAVGFFQAGKWTSVTTSVGRFSGVLRLVPWAAAVVGVTALSKALGDKLQTAVDAVTRKITGMSQAQLQAEQQMRASRFGGKAAEEFNQAGQAADNAHTKMAALARSMTFKAPNVSAVMQALSAIIARLQAVGASARQAQSMLSSVSRASTVLKGGPGGKPAVGSGGGARGGVFTGPKSGYMTLMHGTEAIVPLERSKRRDAARVLAEIGLVREDVKVASGGPGRGIGPSLSVNFTGDIYARDPDEAQASATAIANQVLQVLARSTKAGQRAVLA